MNGQKPEPVIGRYLLSCVIFFILGVTFARMVLDHC